MCCKIMAITELNKAGGAWCQHVQKGLGCSIYSNRPPSCAAFMCGYLLWPNAGDHWLPSKCKMVIVMEDAQRMAIHVDPSTPNIWKARPYHDDLKMWAHHAAQNDQQIVVSIARKMTVILPDSDVYLGFVGEDEIVVSGQRADGSFGARKIKADDPKIAGLEYGKPFRGHLNL